MDPALRGGPAPALLAAPLTFEIECLTSRSARRGGRHAVTLRGDGTLETSHDLAAERVAAAFGGYCSCVDVVDVALPALAEVVGLLTRRVRPDLRRRVDGRWSVSKSVACECPRGFASAATAAQHARSTRHLAARHRIPERLTRLLVDGARTVLPAPEQLMADLTLQARVREPGGLARLWAAGLHPDDIAEWAALAGAVDEPLPSSYYLGVAYGGASTEFLAATLPARPDGETAAWLAWLPLELQRPECRALLAAGLPRQDVVSLLEAGEAPERLAAVAEECGLAPVVVSRLVAVWSRAGCILGAGLVGLLAEHGLTAHRPSATALDELEKAAAVHPHAPGRADLGVMAALLGGRGAVLEALERGVRSAAEVVNWMEKQ